MNQPHYTPLSWPARLGLVLVFTLALAAGVVLSAAFFALFLVLALVGSVWLWWQRRRLRRQGRRQGGDIIEVEYEVLEEQRTRDAEQDRKKP